MATTYPPMPGTSGEDGDASQIRRERLRARVYTLAEMLSQETELAEPLLGHFLRVGEVTILGGHGGQGKSTMSLEMVKAVVSGGTFLGANGEGGNVLVVDLEQGLGVAQRAAMRAFYPSGYTEGVPVAEQVMGMDWDQFGHRVRWADWREGAGGGGWEDMFSVIEDEITLHEPSLVLLDPVYKLFLGSNVNEGEVIGRFVEYLDALRSRCPKVAWLIPMHPRKPPSAGGGALKMHDLYGSAMWSWWAGQVFMLQRTQGTAATFRIEKDRMGQMFLEEWMVNYVTGKGFTRATGDLGGDGRARTTHGKIWELLQAGDGRQFTRRDFSDLLSLSAKRVKEGCAKLEEGQTRGLYAGLTVDVGPNNTKLYSYRTPAERLAVEELKRQFDAIEEDDE